MHNAFLQYERDFGRWVDAGFPEINPLSRDFLAHLKREDAPRKLWRHQQESVYRAVYAYELLQIKDLLLNIVTGGGKTAIIGAIISWLKVCHDIHKFLILCPNTIVRDRIEDDFADATVFRNFAFLPPGTEHYTNELGLHVLEAGSTPQGILDSGIILGNIHQLYQSNINGQRNLACIMNYVEHLAVFNDEAHNTPAEEYDRTLFALSPKCRFRLDTTATPDRADGKTPDTKMIYEYTIADAQSEVPPIIKSIVVYQPKVASVQLTYTNPDTGEKRTVDELDEEFERIEKGLSATQWVTDPDPMRKQMGIAIERLDEQKRRAASIGHGKYQPILFVVGICIKDAKAAAEMLSMPKEKGGFGIKSVVVTEESTEEERLLAGVIGKRGDALEETRKNLERKFDLSKARELIEKGSQLEAVVSVLMLREGWDLPAVSVILLLRKFSSRVYGQQVVGRGLRLNIRGEDAQEFCAIVDHEKLKHQWLWEIVGARIKKDVDQGNLFGNEDLPPKRKPQVMNKPEKLIEIPKPEEEEAADFSDLDDLTVIEGDYPNWKSILESFEYGAEVEITKVEIDSVKGEKLDDEGFIEIFDAPPPMRVEERNDEPLPEILIETLKHSVRDIAADLLAEEGIGSHELGYIYGILMDHVRSKLLSGKSAGEAPMDSLKRALWHCRNALPQNIKDKPGLIASMVKYKKAGTNAGK
jgi:superfamily II DNA or RNA helicase